MDTKKGLNLFTPVQLGSLNLKHRVVMAPLTRSRSEQPGGIPGDMMVRYYSDRASDGGLIISEATNISLTARGWYGAPGIYTEEQTQGWGKDREGGSRQRRTHVLAALAYWPLFSFRQS